MKSLASYAQPIDAHDAAAFLRSEGFEVDVRESSQRGGGWQGIAVTELWVDDDRLEAARAALAKAPAIKYEQLPGATDSYSAKDGKCAIHDAPLDVPCARCGVFVCGKCVEGEAEPLCDTCDEKAFQESRKSRDKRGTRFNIGCVLALVGTIGVAIAVSTLLR